ICPNGLGFADDSTVLDVGLLFTVWVTPLPPVAEDARKLLSPGYVAGMVGERVASELRVSGATPETFKVPVPAGVPLSRKLTVPVGVPLPPAEAVTVALRVIAWPETLGLGELVSVVALGLLFTVWVTPLPPVAEEVRKLLSPAYTA